jgi:hypothetical protein
MIMLMPFVTTHPAWAQKETISKEKNKKDVKPTPKSESVKKPSKQLTPEEEEIIQNWEILELWDMLEENDIELLEDLETIEQIKNP